MTLNARRPQSLRSQCIEFLGIVFKRWNQSVFNRDLRTGYGTLSTIRFLDASYEPAFDDRMQEVKLFMMKTGLGGVHLNNVIIYGLLILNT